MQANVHSSQNQLKPFDLSLLRRGNIDDLLELLFNSHDIHSLVKILPSIGLYILSSEVNDARIVQCDQLYEKIALVLNSGLQVKTTIALNLLSALQYQKEGTQMREKSLHVYAQNMIRISGCLTAMINLFINSMLHQETLKALCRCISEACHDAVSNQTYSSHLVPLCIRRCREGSSDMFIVLRSLLSGHSRNVKLFYESNGMVIFTRESLQHTFCLQLLNTVVESTTSGHMEIFLKSYYLFEHLRYLLQRYGASNSIGQWASVILFWQQKVLSRDGRVVNVPVVEINDEETDAHSRSVHKKTNETNELLRNILSEVIGIQNADNKTGKNTRPVNINNINLRTDPQYAGLNKIDIEKKVVTESFEYKRNEDALIVSASACNELSFSFLLKNRLTKNKLKDQTCNIFGLDSNRILYNYSHGTQNLTRHDKIPAAPPTADNDKTINFAPPYVSTPKSSTITNTGYTSKCSRETLLLTPRLSKRKRDIRTRVGKKKRMLKSKKVQNKSIGAKFFDIINGSCTTLVKSVSSFKNIFFGKVPATCKDESINTSCTDHSELTPCSNSFTNYMRKRDKTRLENERSIEDVNQRSCNTCNNTIALKQKLTNNTNLQETVKKLKFGINLYGCDFKKISRTMWPNEPYMSPRVLYSLYRKVIMK